MSAAYVKIAAMLVTIALGYFLHQIHVFERQDSRVLLKILMNVTLPCLVVSNLNGMTVTKDLVMASLLGIVINTLYFGAAFLLSKRGDAEDHLVKIFALSTFNTGSYVIPFLTGIASSYSLAGVFAFTYPGTALFTYGISPAAAGLIYSGQKGERSPARILLDKLLHTVSCDVCVIMLLLSLFRISLPSGLVSVCASIGSASSTLAMLSIGILMDLKLPEGEFIHDIGLVLARLCISLLCALTVYFLLPLAYDIRAAIALTVFAPAASYNSVMALHCGYKGSRVAVISSLEMILSIASTTVVTSLLF